MCGAAAARVAGVAQASLASLAACAMTGAFAAAPLGAAPAASAGPAAAPLPVVRYGVLAQFPPFQVWPEGNRPGGADLELVRDLAERAGVVVQPLRYTDFAKLEADLFAGRIDMASAMALTREREALLAFTPPYTQVPLALVTRADQPSAALLPDLAGRSIVVVRNFASSEAVDRLFPLASRVVVPSLREGMDAVRSGRADLLLELLPTLSDLIARDGVQGLSIVRQFDAPSGRLHLAFAPAQAVLAARFRTALLQLPAGRADSLVQGWSAPPPPRLGGQLDISAAERRLLDRWRAPVLGVVGNDAPFATRAPDGSEGAAQGLSVDMLAAVLRRLDVTPGATVFLRADELQQALLERRVDIVIGADEGVDRTPLLRFVGPFIEYPTVLIARPDSGAFDLAQLQGRRLALTPSNPARPLLESRYPSVTVLDCSDLQACIDMVNRRAADATLADVVGAALALARNPRPALLITGSEPQLRRYHSLALADRHAAVVPAFKRALDQAMAAELPAIKTRWFSRPGPREVALTLLRRYGPGSALLLLLLAGLAFWHLRRVRAEMQRTRTAQQQAEGHAAAARRFSTFLAHEVRNSLHAVVAGTELARLPGHDGPALQRMVADSARSTLHLMNDLIDRERLHAGRLVLRPEPARISTLLQAVADEMAPAAQVRGLRLQVQPADFDGVPQGAEPLLLVDGLRLQQVLRNLLSNAIKYSDAGVIELQSRLAGPPDAREVQIEVRDRGPGIDAARLPTLFEPFNAPAGVASSAGLGLPLSRELMRLMGGSLGLAPRAGGGTVAGLRFPAHADDAGPAPAASAASVAPVLPLVSAAPRSDVPAALRVLVVEDAEVYGLLLVRALQLRGHHAEAQSTLAAARIAVQSGFYDLVLADMQLPDGDVSSLLQWLHEAAPEPRPRVTLMTADLDTAPPQLSAMHRRLPLFEKSDDVLALVERVLRGVEAPPSGARAAV